MAGMQTIREGLTGNITKLIVVAIIITFVGSIGWAGFFSQGNANIIAKNTNQIINKKNQYSFHQFVIRTTKRNMLQKYLAKNI